MRLSTAVTLALTVLLAMSAIGAVVATSTTAVDPVAQPADDGSVSEPPSGAISSATASTLQSESTSTADNATFERADPEQIFRITIAENGDARWTIESRFNLTSDEEVAVFEEWANSVTSGERSIEYDISPFRAAAAEAEQATGREMEIRNPGWDEPRIEHPEDVDNEDENATRVGVVTYSFTWTNFASADGDRVYVGDAFYAPNEPVLQGLHDGQRLVIESPPNYALETPTRLVWDGPHQFEDGDLEIVFLRGAGQSMLSWVLTGGLVVLGLLVAVGAYFAYRSVDGTSDVDLTLPTFGLPDSIRTDADAEPAEPDPKRTPRGDDGSGRPTVTAQAGGSETGTHVEFEEEIDDEIDPELLSDEERVQRMLKRNGGRMKQASIVKETGWSNAKVSQLLSKMDENGEIEKLRIGRENLITLPEVDPTELD